MYGIEEVLLPEGTSRWSLDGNVDDGVLEGLDNGAESWSQSRVVVPGRPDEGSHRGRNLGWNVEPLLLHADGRNEGSQIRKLFERKLAGKDFPQDDCKRVD